MIELMNFMRVFKLINKKRFVWLLVFLFLQALSMLTIPTLAADIIDNGVATGDIDYIFRYGLIMVIVAVLGFISALINVYLSATESQGIGVKLRDLLFDKILHSSNEDIDKFGTSTLITRTTSDVMQVQQVSMLLLRFAIIDPFRIIIAAVLAFMRAPRLAIVFVLIIPILVILVALVLRKVSPLFRSLQRKTDNINRIFREGLTGIRVIRAFNREDYEEERFDEANIDYKDTSILANTYMALMNPLMILVISATSMAIIWFGGQLVSTGSMEVGNIIAFMSYAANILVGIMMLSIIITMVPRVQVALERIFAVLDSPQEIKDPIASISPNVEDEELVLKFDHVNFSYPNTEKRTLKDISFTVREGERLAIIGSTGSGKTTLSELLIRLYDVDSGSITINGVDIREMSQAELRKHIGFATQDALLFSGTIRENLKYGNDEATDEELWKALEIAQGADFVSNLPNGLDSRVEQGGDNFSGGQRQRLSIARALVTDAEILVFDDSFSALDFKTDANLRQALKEVTTEKAEIIIAQRINTVVDADQIIVLNQGEISGIGTHEELSETNEIYQEIIDSQMNGEDF